MTNTQKIVQCAVEIQKCESFAPNAKEMEKSKIYKNFID